MVVWDLLYISSRAGGKYFIVIPKAARVGRCYGKPDDTLSQIPPPQTKNIIPHSLSIFCLLQLSNITNM